LLLYNPLTRRSIVRRTFKVMGPVKPSNPEFFGREIFLESPIEANEEVVKNVADKEQDPRLLQEGVAPGNEFTEEEYVVEKILDMSGSLSRIHSMKFLVRWQGYSPSADSWEPYKELKDNSRLHDYFRSNNITRYLPKRYWSNSIANHASGGHGEAEMIPSTIRQARRNSSSSAVWDPAISAELKSMRDLGVWSVTPVRLQDVSSRNVGNSKLVFVKQTNSDGSLKKYKARIVYCGNQWPVSNVVDRYAATVRSESVRMILAIAAERDLEMEAIDVKTAFLHSPLPEGDPIYMRRPSGMNDSDMPYIVQLQKGLYGLPHAAALFRKHLHGVLTSIGFNALVSDSCVYIKTLNSDYIIAMVHVDDIGLVSTKKQMIEEAKQGLREIYDISVVSDMSQYLGLSITRDRKAKKIMIDQGGYIDSFLETYGITKDDKDPVTPMDPDDEARFSKLNKSEVLSRRLDKEGVTLYQAMVGSLMYLAKQTRPDSVCSGSCLKKLYSTY
jgi:hypothetical protein